MRWLQEKDLLLGHHLQREEDQAVQEGENNSPILFF